jgi:hypothetical protein
MGKRCARAPPVPQATWSLKRCISSQALLAEFGFLAGGIAGFGYEIKRERVFDETLSIVS